MNDPAFFTITHRVKALLVFCILFFSLPNAKSQVVLNEVMVRPGGNQGLIFFNGNSGNEYVELYNPSCSPIDVSGYFIACRQEFAGTTSGGAFRIPNVSAAIILPGKHLVLGTSTSSADPNSIDIKLPDYAANYCQNNSSYNFILANADGWVALYNASGTPIDAIYWSSSAANISQAADYAGIPCVPVGSPMGTTLESAQQINNSFPGVLSYVGGNPSAGLTYSRVPDGAVWQVSINPSINDLSTGNCNGGNCVPVSSITFTSVVTNPSCAQSNGSIAINVTSPGVATFAWSANASTANNNTANNLAAGNYTVTITQNGCTKDTAITLVAPNSPALTISNIQNPTCSGNDGSLNAAISGGTAPYNVSIDTGAGPTINITLPIATYAPVNNLPAGTVSINIVDFAGCSVTQSVTLTAPTNCCQFNFSAAVTQPNCGATDGAISITVANGSGNYSYTWSSNANAGNVSQASSLGAGNYLITITDLGFSNCTKDTTISLSSAGAPVINSITKTDESCLGENDGSATVVANGGTGTLTYLWNSGQQQPSINNLSPGNYIVSVTDANGCLATGNITVLQGPVCCALFATINVVQSECNAATGSIDITVDLNSGMPPFQYSINGGTTYSSNNLFNSLAAATYYVAVADANNCIFRDTVDVAEANNDLNISVIATDITCNGFNNGVGTLTINTGTGSPFTINWSNGVNDSFYINNLSVGNYSVTVVNQINCSRTASFSISEPQPLTVDLGNDQTLCDGQTISLDAGNPGLNYSWSNGEQTQLITANNSGLYSVTITDNNGCSATDSIEVNAILISINAGNDTIINEQDEILLKAILTGNSTGGTYAWTPSTYLSCNDCSTPLAKPLVTSDYVVTYYSIEGCLVSDNIEVTVIPGKYFFWMPDAFSPNGDGSNDVLFPYFKGVKKLTLRIWNRWGEKVFECNTMNCGWNGSLNGKLLDSSVFVWEAVVEFEKPSIERYKGSLTLIK